MLILLLFLALFSTVIVVLYELYGRDEIMERLTSIRLAQLARVNVSSRRT